MNRFFSHVAAAILEGSLIALLVVGLIAGTALAGKPGGSTSGGSAFRVADGVFAGQSIAYAGSSSATTVHARCYQGGVLVFEQYRAYLADRTTAFDLGPTPSWTSGAANCTAEEGYWFHMTRWRPVSSTSFNVAA